MGAATGVRGEHKVWAGKCGRYCRSINIGDPLKLANLAFLT